MGKFHHLLTERWVGMYRQRYVFEACTQFDEVNAAMCAVLMLIGLRLGSFKTEADVTCDGDALAVVRGPGLPIDTDAGPGAVAVALAVVAVVLPAELELPFLLGPWADAMRFLTAAWATPRKSRSVSSLPDFPLERGAAVLAFAATVVGTDWWGRARPAPATKAWAVEVRSALTRRDR